jgi:hypothetical protein
MDHTVRTIWLLPIEQRNLSPGYEYCYTRVHTIENLLVNATTTGPIIYFNDSANCNVNNISCNVTWVDTTVLVSPPPGEKVLITFTIKSQISPQEFRVSNLVIMEVCHVFSASITEYWYHLGG